jgi:hypothetical protein
MGDVIVVPNKAKLPRGRQERGCTRVQTNLASFQPRKVDEEEKEEDKDEEVELRISGSFSFENVGAGEARAAGGAGGAGTVDRLTRSACLGTCGGTYSYNNGMDKKHLSFRTTTPLL